MRRWNPLFLIALLVVVLATVVSITPPGASAHSFPSSISLIKGRIVAKNSDTHYFVLSFTCSLSGTTGTGTLSGNWTYEVGSMSSISGMVEPGASCSFSSTGGQVTLTAPTSPLPSGTGNLVGAACGATCTLTLSLSNIIDAKTFFNLPTPPSTEHPQGALCTSSASSAPCLDVEASGFNSIADFSSQPQCLFTTPPSCPQGSIPPGFPFATLNRSTQ